MPVVCGQELSKEMKAILPYNFFKLQEIERERRKEGGLFGVVNMNKLEKYLCCISVMQENMKIPCD